MSDLVFEEPCVLFALRREAQSFLKEFRPYQRIREAPCWAQFCGPSWLSVVVLETGLGEDRAAQAAAWALSQPLVGKVPFRPKVVLSAGFSGAVNDKYITGDVILATVVLDSQGNRWPASWPGELPEGEWRPVLHREAVVTAARVIGTPEEKRALGQATGAAAVDMEAATIARLCARSEVPFGCVRVILDDLQTPLSPRLIRLLSGGRISLPRIASEVLRSPGLVPQFWQLGRKSRKAVSHLGSALGELLTLTLPWTPK